MVAQRAHVARGLPVGERARRVRRSAVAARVRDDQAVAPRQRIDVEQMWPVLAGAGESVQQQQRLARAAHLVVNVSAFDRNVAHDWNPFRRPSLRARQSR